MKVIAFEVDFDIVVVDVVDIVDVVVAKKKKSFRNEQLDYFPP